MDVFFPANPDEATQIDSFYVSRVRIRARPESNGKLKTDAVASRSTAAAAARRSIAAESRSLWLVLRECELHTRTRTHKTQSKISERKQILATEPRRHGS